MDIAFFSVQSAMQMNPNEKMVSQLMLKINENFTAP